MLGKGYFAAKTALTNSFICDTNHLDLFKSVIQARRFSVADCRHLNSKRVSQNPPVSGRAKSLPERDKSLSVGTQQQPEKSRITDALIIASVTVMAYIWALFYELG